MWLESALAAALYFDLAPTSRYTREAEINHIYLHTSLALEKVFVLITSGAIHA